MKKIYWEDKTRLPFFPYISKKMVRGFSGILFFQLYLSCFQLQAQESISIYCMDVSLSEAVNKIENETPYVFFRSCACRYG